MNTKKLISCILILTCAITIYSCSKGTTQRRVGGSGGPNPPEDTKGLKVFSNVIYGSNVNYTGQQESLAMDFYVPETAISSGDKLPFILFVHGGGFVRGDKTADNDFVVKMAKKGYVVASINYRLGRDYDSTNLCAGDTTDFKKALYRAVQDCNAAMRFAIYHANDYNIDTSWVFTSGKSAGCATILASHYNTEEVLAGSTSDFSDELGGLNDADNDLKATYTLKGMVPMWGDVSDINLITSITGVPSIFFHGGKDPVAPIGVAKAYYCDNYFLVYGSAAMYDKLTSLGISAVLHVDPDGGHGVFNDDFLSNNADCFLTSVMSKQYEKGYYSGFKTSCP